ncbi:hypothetical protein HDV05_002556 [Chytridiales sp. JEL 0842]|nr:hypothetical protein HDV05_002556 [Chytridiales sp. JEL 0842]
MVLLAIYLLPMSLTSRKPPLGNYLTDNNRNELLPIVDVLITTCGEPLEVVKKTVRGCVGMNYPRRKLRVWVLDDAGRGELERWVESGELFEGEKESGVGKVKKSGERVLKTLSMPQVFYRSRIKDGEELKDFKAGNLNYALRQIQLLTLMGHSPPSYIAQFDTDMTPHPNFLRRLLPHLLLNPNVGIVSVPQRFSNTPNPDFLSQSMDFFFSTLAQATHDQGCGTYMGSGYIFRLSALRSIGGFGVETINEDFNTSIKALRNGWETVLVNEDLQIGLSSTMVKTTLIAAKPARSGIYVGLNKGHVTTSRAQKPKPSNRKGALSKRTKFVRDLVREVVGFAPYERRVMELLKNSRDKRARRLAKRRLGTFQRAKKKVEELSNVIAESRRTAH